MQLLLYLFLACCAIQALYNLVFAVALSKRSIKQQPATGPVSIVVAVHNELPNLQRLITSLLNQRYHSFEVIIVDDRSTDGSTEFLKKAAEESNLLRAIRVDHTPIGINPKKHAVATGIGAASNDIILLTDGDCYPHSNLWISETAARFSDETMIAIGYSQYEKQSSLLNYFIRFETLLTAIQYMSLAILGRPYMGVGRNLAYRKSFFIGSGGFEGIEGITGGDDDLFVNKHSLAENTVITTGTDSLVLSVPKEKVADFFKQKIRHLSVGKRYKTLDKIILGSFTLSNIICWIALIPLAIKAIHPPPLIIALSIKISTMFVVFYAAKKKLGDRLSLWGIVLLDIIFVFYYITTGLAALVSKKVKWS